MTESVTTPLSAYALSALDDGPFETVFGYAAAAEVRVILLVPGSAAQLLTVGDDYTLAPGAATLEDGGAVTLDASILPAVAWATGSKLVIMRATALDQATPLADLAGVPPSVLEAMFNRAVRQLQDTEVRLDRALMFPLNEQGQTLPMPTGRAGLILGFDDDGDIDPTLTRTSLVEEVADGITPAAVAQVAAAGTTNVGLVNAAGTTNVGLVNTAGTTNVGSVNAAGSTQVAAVAAQGVTSAGVVDAAGIARLSQIALAAGYRLFPTTAKALSNGVIGFTGLTGGSGGTNGTFNLAFTGGAGSGAGGRFVVSGGALVSAFLRNSGDSYTSAPTVSLAASSGLTGAALTAVIGPNVNVGDYFFTPGTDGKSLVGWEVTAGPTATARPDLDQYVSNAADPQTLVQARARLDTQVVRDFRDYPALLPVRMYAGTLSTGSVNADGTYPLAAGATWVSANLDFAPFNVSGNIFLYAVLTGQQTGALEIRIHQAGTTIKAGNTVTQPSPGVYKQSWSNTAPLSHVTITITNVSGSTVNLYPIELYQTDTAYLPQVLSMAETVFVPENRRIIDWDAISPYARWGQRDNAEAVLTEAGITVAFDSVGGSDAAAGARFAPKQTLDAGSTLTEGAVVGFKKGSTWRESYNDLGTTTKGIRLRNYADGEVGQRLPLIKGCKSLTGATWTLESGSCWRTDIVTDAAATAYDGYSYIKVIETTVADATAKPLGSTRALTRATSKANCIATVGSFFVENLTGANRRVYVNPRDGIIPSSSTLYTYEATDRYCVVNWVAGNVRQGVMQGIEVYDSAFGYGAISGGPKSMFSGIIASHGGTHTLKIEAGEVRDFILYNKGTVASAGNCYISPNANGYSWRWVNGMAYDCYTSAFYSHAAAGSYTKGEYLYCWVNGERQANGALVMGDAFVCDQVTATLTEWCYVKGHQRPTRAGNSVGPVNSILRNCLFREIGIFYSNKLTENCIAQVENQSDPDSVNNRNMILCRMSEDHVVQKCIVHATNTDVSGYAAALSDYSATIFDLVATGLNNPNARQNIFLVETHLATAQTIVTGALSTAFQSNYNVYIFCPKRNITSFKTSGTGTKRTVAEYLAEFTGHDGNSLFVDLRDDPRGARAVFMDPANGDYRWAQTNVALAIKAYCEANNVGPDWTMTQWPTMPTVDEAAAMLARAY